jgi:hypothetical protein
VRQTTHLTEGGLPKDLRLDEAREPGLDHSAIGADLPGSSTGAFPNGMEHAKTNPIPQESTPHLPVAFKPHRAIGLSFDDTTPVELNVVLAMFALELNSESVSVNPPVPLA